MHPENNDNGISLVHFATSKNLIVKSRFPIAIFTNTWTWPDGIAHNQIDHVLVDKRRHSNIIDIRSFRGADCDIGHYLVVTTIPERLSLKKLFIK